jgi:hypothetical protein
MDERRVVVYACLVRFGVDADGVSLGVYTLGEGVDDMYDLFLAEELTTGFLKEDACRPRTIMTLIAAASILSECPGSGRVTSGLPLVTDLNRS